MRLPKASPTCVPEASVGTTNEQPSGQLRWSGIRQKPEPLLHRKTKLAILHQCQVARSLIRAGSSPSSSQATEVCCSFLCINSSPSDPPPKGWHFYSCFSGKASLPFLKQHVQKLQATCFSDCLLLPGSGEFKRSQTFTGMDSHPSTCTRFHR